MKKIVYICIAFLTLSACKRLVDGYSTDPVNITDASVIETNKFLSGVQVNVIGMYSADVARLTGMWTEHFSGEDRQYIPLANYSVAGRDFNNNWATIYGVVKNSDIIIERATEANNFRMLGIAQILKAMAFGLAADLYGDVPFSEAGKFPEIVTPKYDSQLEVYAGVQALLDEAIANLQRPIPAALNPGVADFFFNGDPTKWTRAANTLKARFYLHAKDYPNAITSANSGISNPADNMLAPHGGSYLQNFNLYYSFLVYDRFGYMEANSLAPRLLDTDEAGNRNHAKTNEEARLNYLYFVNGGGFYEPNYLFSGDFGTPASSDGFFGAATSFPIVTFEENTLILAEAHAKQGAFVDALDALNALRTYYRTGNHVNSDYRDFDFVYDDFVATDFDNGGIENPDNIAPIDALLREILEERYITFTGQLEAFNDIRRTKNLLNIPIKPGSSKFPQRLLYPQSEVNANAANIPAGAIGLFDETRVNQTPY
jgi:hypothetical protein